MSACSSPQPIRTAERVDLDRFMGDWYVVANIPTSFERNAWNALEQYSRNERGEIETTFTFNKGAADGPEKVYRPKGFVTDDPSNAVWGMQFIWPFKAEYRILHVDEDYSETIIGRRKRDYLWIMTRVPHPDEAQLERLIQIAVEEGYLREKIQRVPHVVEGRSE